MLDQPLNYKDKLLSSLAEIRQFIEANPLEAKLHIKPTIGGATAAEEGIDRTAEDAKRASKEGVGGEAGATGGIPWEKIQDSFERLAKAMEGFTAKFEKGIGGLGRGGRRKAVAPDGTPAAEPEEKTDYINPYLVKSLATNPMGAMGSIFQSMVMDGSGHGVKAPGFLKEMLVGTSGEFKPGQALGRNLTGEGFLGAGGKGGPLDVVGEIPLVGSLVGAVVGAFTAAWKIQSNASENRIKDATNYVEDIRFQRGAGINWREAAYGGQDFQTRSDLHTQDIRSIIGASGVRFGGLRGRGEGQWQMLGHVQEAVNSAMNMGISNEQMGGLIGAGVRSGTVVMGGDNAVEDTRKYLRSIEKWVEVSATHNISTSDSLKTMSELSGRAQGNAGFLSQEMRARVLSYQEGITKTMPAELQQHGGQDVMSALMANPTSDIEKVNLMNQLIGDDNKLTPEADKIGSQAYKGRWEQMKSSAGGNAAILAKTMVENPGITAFARIQRINQLKSRGLSDVQIMTNMNIGLPEFASLSSSMENNPELMADFGQLGGARNMGKTEIVAKGTQAETEEIELSKLAQVRTVLSGLVAETAASVKKVNLGLELFARSAVDAADNLKMNLGTKVTAPNSGGYNREILPYK